MSQLVIKNAFEEAIAAMTPEIDTAYANRDFKPTTNQPYQEVSLLPAAPDNGQMSNDKYREQGLIQIMLCYPLNKGELPALTRAELIRTTFKRGTTLSKNSINIDVVSTPTISAGFKDNDRWKIPVRIFYLADIHL